MKGKEQKGVSKEHLEQEEELARAPIMSERTDQVNEETQEVKEAVVDENGESDPDESAERNTEAAIDGNTHETEEGTSVMTAHCGVQLGRRQLRRQLQDEKSKMRARETVAIPTSQNIDGQSETSPTTMEEDHDEESALSSMSPPREEGNETPNEVIQDVAPSVGVQNDARSIDIEQDTIIKDPEGGGTQANTTGDVDDATAVFSAYLAPNPEEARQRALDNAVVATNVRTHPSEQQTTENKWKAPLIGLAVVVAIALAVSPGVSLRGRNSNNSSASMSPTPAPTSARFGQAVSLVESLFNTTFEDLSTPQYQAAQWMAEADAWFGDLAAVDSERFRQRYILALFYFATGGPTSWIETSFFLKPDVHECEWVDIAPPNTASWNGGYVGVFNCSSDDWVEGIEINQNNAA